MRKILFVIFLGFLCLDLASLATSQRIESVSVSRFEKDQRISTDQSDGSKKRKKHSKNKSKKGSRSGLNRKVSQKRRKNQKYNHEFLKPHQPQFWFNSLLALFLSCAGGFCSGMTVGLNSINPLSLEVYKLTGNKEEKRMSTRILKTIAHHHLFLVTLLIGNAIVLQSLPLVVHTLMPDWMAILFSTFAVVIVAEIVPMSATTGKLKIVLAYYGAPLVNLMMWIFYPLAYPMALGLDWLLGKEEGEGSNGKVKRRDFLTLINDPKKNELKELEIIMINQLFVDAAPTLLPKQAYRETALPEERPHHIAPNARSISEPVQQFIVLRSEDEINREALLQIQSSKENFFMCLRHKAVDNEIQYTAIDVRQFAFSYLQLKAQQKSYLLANFKPKLSQVLAYRQKLSPESGIEKKMETVDQTQGLASLLSIFESSKRSEVYRSDVLVIKSFDDTKCTGIVTLQNVQKAVVDFEGRYREKILRKIEEAALSDADSFIGDLRSSQKGEPQTAIAINVQRPPRRKLIKRASIDSSNYNISF